MTDTIEYKIIIIDSDNVQYNKQDYYDFFINLADPLRDVYKIKVLYSAVSISNTNIKNQSKIKNLDNIYIRLNSYDRTRTSIINTTTIPNIIYNLSYFDSIMIDQNKVKDITDINETTMFNDFNENEGDYYLNPIASQLNRFDIILHDKNNNVIDKTYLSRFVMKLCIYYNTKKLSRF
jgi:hypothetical protein